MEGVIEMLSVKDKIKLLKLKKLEQKQKEAFVRGDYVEAAKYGKQVEHYITDVLKLDEVPSL